MKKTATWLTRLLMLVLAAAACTPPEPVPIPEPSNKKVIVSHLGEVTEDLRYAGETIRYKIYYRNNSKQQTDIRIIDRLDNGLEQINVFNNGSYVKPEKMIVWEINDVPAETGGFVEFEAEVGTTDTVKNQALIQIGARKLLETFDPGRPIKDSDKIIAEPAKRISDLSKINEIKTNTVITKVCKMPQLGWIPFSKDARAGDIPRANMKDETTMTTTMNFDVPGMFVHEVKVDNVTYHRLSIPGRAWLADVGKPEVPIVGEIIEVPYGVNFNIEIVKSKSISLKHYNVYPAQRQYDRESTKEEKFALNKSTYLTDGPYPAEPAVIKAEDIGVIRGHRVVFLKINPIQYNPVTREIKAFSNIEVRLKFDHPAQIKPVDRRIKSGAFEEFLQATLLNFKNSNRFDAPGDDDPGQEREGCDYLIITHSDFYNASDANNPIVKFRNWKQQKGYKTKVVDVANIPGGSTAADIKAYLDGAYKNWSPPPTYVLLVGDAGDNTGNEIIPAHYQTAHPFPDYNNAEIGTDLYYATLDGTDYFPDMFIGRLPVDTLAQAEDIVDKIMNYEKTPPANAAFYTDASLVALFEDDTDKPGDAEPEDGREDRPWIENIEEIYEHLENNGYNPERIYATSSGFPGDPNSDIPQQYEDSTNLPADLQFVNGFQWNGSDANITAAINNGRFLVTYRDHGSRTGWSGFFGFNTGDIGGLANGALTPAVFSLACENGWFDNETDDDATLGALATGNAAESFCEHFLRQSNGGAVAIIGATRASRTGYNDFLMFGLHKAIWPDFSPNPPVTGYPALPAVETGRLLKMGHIHVFGQIYMANAYASSDARKIQFEMYHLFGDPEMEVWTEEPNQLRVDHPEGIGSVGLQDFVVKVTDDNSTDPVQSATVVLTRNGSILAVRQTNPGGFARFTLNSLGVGDLDLTVTVHNYTPYEGKMKVIADGAAVNRLEPDNGMENQVVNVGGQNFSGSENVDIYFADQHMLTKAASGGNFGQAGVEDVNFTVPSPYDLGPVNVLAHGQTSDLHGVDVFQVRTANPIDLYTYDQWDNTTWHLHSGDNPTWNNPEIQLYDNTGSPVESNNLIAGHSYTIKAKIHNDTDFNADHVKVTFKWANFGLGQSERVWTDIDTDDLNVPDHHIEEAEVNWAPTTGHLCILAEIYHIEDINEGNNKGQENCHVGPTSSPAVVPFLVWNPTKEPAMVHLELRQQLDSENQEEGRVLWGSWVTHPDPQLIQPGDRREAQVIIDPDFAKTKIRPGQEAEFSLTGFVDGKVIGGADFIIKKK